MPTLELVTSLQPWKVKPVRAALLVIGIHSLLEPTGRGFNLWVVDRDLQTAMATCWQTELSLVGPLQQKPVQSKSNDSRN